MGDEKKVKCLDCNYVGKPMIVYPTCDKEDEEDHDECTDDCNPTEKPLNEFKKEPVYAPFKRCAKCKSLNIN